MADDTPQIRPRTVIIAVVIAALIGSVIALGIIRMQDHDTFATVTLNGTSPAPPIKGTNLMTGKPVALSDFRGKPVVLNVWAEWCDPCRREAPALKTFAKEHPDVAVLGVSTDPESVAKARQFVTDAGWTYPSINDESGHLAYNVLRVSGLPATFYIDAQGIVRGRSPGELTLSELNDVAGRLTTMTVAADRGGKTTHASVN